MPKNATVVLLPTLHQFHAVARTYGFRTLRQIIEELRPRLEELARSSGQWSLAPRLEQRHHEPG